MCYGTIQSAGSLGCLLLPMAISQRQHRQPKAEYLPLGKVAVSFMSQLESQLLNRPETNPCEATSWFMLGATAWAITVMLGRWNSLLMLPLRHKPDKQKRVWEKDSSLV